MSAVKITKLIKVQSRLSISTADVLHIRVDEVGAERTVLTDKGTVGPINTEARNRHRSPAGVGLERYPSDVGFPTSHRDHHQYRHV